MVSKAWILFQSQQAESPPLTSSRSCYICTDVFRVVGHDVALFGADFHFICCCSVCESVSEDFKFTIAIAHKMSSANRGLHMDLPPLEIECGGHGVFLHDLL